MQPGPASKSYGIQVARLAGMPAAVVNHARQALEALEAQQTQTRAQVDLFAPPPAAEAPATSAVESAAGHAGPRRDEPAGGAGSAVHTSKTQPARNRSRLSRPDSCETTP